jgi:hypothetical protein
VSISVTERATSRMDPSRSMDHELPQVVTEASGKLGSRPRPSPILAVRRPPLGWLGPPFGSKGGGEEFSPRQKTYFPTRELKILPLSARPSCILMARLALRRVRDLFC